MGDLSRLMEKFMSTFRGEIWNKPSLPIHFILTSCETKIGKLKDIICQDGVE